MSTEPGNGGGVSTGAKLKSARGSLRLCETRRAPYGGPPGLLNGDCARWKPSHRVDVDDRANPASALVCDSFLLREQRRLYAGSSGD
jgi:hypothetical protein